MYRLGRMVVLVLLLGLSFLGTATAQSAGAPSTGSSTPQNVLTRSTADAVQTTFFGMHILFSYSNTPWPAIPIAAWRLWDSNVGWNELEPAKGEWYFEILDGYVSTAEAHNVEILLTLGKTPTWASARPMEYSPYNQSGSAAEPRDIEDWKNYVRTVASRYKGKIRYYEIWNEPNLTQYYSGTLEQMVILAREAYAVLKAIDPSIMVVSPSATGDYGVPWLEQYLELGGGSYADIIGYHFYVIPDPPEAMVPVANSVRQAMVRNGVRSKPLWNTETGWFKPKVFSSEAEGVSYVARSYIPLWAAGVDRFYWFAWDAHDALDMTGVDNKTLKLTGVAYAEVQKWLLGAKMMSCGQNNQGLWVAQITRSGGYSGWIVWSPDKAVDFDIPKEWDVTNAKSLGGTSTSIPEARRVSIDMVPVLLDNGSRPASPQNPRFN